MHAGGGANAHRADEDMHEYQVHLLERATHDMGSWDDKQKNLAGTSECRNGRLGPLTVAATLTRPFLRTALFSVEKGAAFDSNPAGAEDMDASVATAATWAKMREEGLATPLAVPLLGLDNR